jgi:hypothetical protein
MVLALFTGEERFGGPPETASPPATLDASHMEPDSSRVGVELAPFSAALYLGSPGLASF